MRKPLFATLIIAASVFSSLPVLASSGGTLTFHGAIVEEVCSVTQATARIDLRCPRGHRLHRQTLFLRGDGPHEHDSAWVHSRFDYLNATHTLGILTLTYR
ncbi:FIG00554470: hypothetical protein [Cronobacter condimenti 1330]|uniref:Type 1 fimbrial protein n=1 Tax=Cronobacter condimenti 1330 TaxID=1073999 RepID=K8A6W8_9ENTR|nr:type 1 fimbrial protein [Cronobacter condimenti]ALB62370.1 hypothetical protein AFK62_07580 [Cronobacter condimenti 1330]CCJ71394.1 FIG00554470: hypothetical protein [Cronobacter condimenti 1330]